MDQKIKNIPLSISAKYDDLYSLRSLVQAIPIYGGSIDTLLSGAGANFKQKRIESFLHELQKQISRIEKSKFKLNPEDIEGNEDVYDLFINCIERSSRTKSEEKRKRFAQIFTNQTLELHFWDEATLILKMIDSLSDLDIKILNLAVHAPPCSKPFEGLRVVQIYRNDRATVTVKDNLPISLQEKLSELPIHALEQSCASLLANGLLQDEGPGRLGAKTMEFFTPTDTGIRLVEWISEK